jgi:hypothetical protein
MATVPYSPVPSVTPESSAPAGYQNIPSDASDFGGLIGQGEHQLASGLSNAGTDLFGAGQLIQERHNLVAVDDAFNQLQQKNLDRLFGTKDNPGGFYGLKGAAAMAAQGPTVAGMEADRQAIKNNLQNEAQQLKFEQDSRRMNLFQQEAIGRHAATQSTLWDVQTQQASEELKLRDIGHNPNDETNFQHQLADGMYAARKKAASAGGGPEIIENAAQKFSENAYAARVQGMAATDPSGALAYLKANQKSFNPAHYDQIQSALEGKARAVDSDRLADDAYNGRTAATPRPSAASRPSVSLADIHPALTTVSAPGGAKLTVAQSAAPKFQGLINDLEAEGYKLDPNQSGGYNPRNIAGTDTPSEHAYGRAIDVNWQRNAKGGPSDLPPELARRLAAKWGLTWGGDWSGADRDPMHFEVSQAGGTDHPGGAATGWNANNPLNIMQDAGGAVTPKGVHLATYGSMAEGVAATAAKLKAYQDERGLNTVRQMYTEWHKDSLVNEADMTGIAKALGVGLDDPFTLDATKAAAWIRQAQPGETGTAGKRLSDADLAAGVAQFARGGPKLATDGGVRVAGGPQATTPDGTPVIPAGFEKAAALGAIFPTKNDAYQRVIASGADDATMRSAITKLNAKYAVEEKARKDAEEGAADKIVQMLIKDPTKVAPEAISDNPYLSSQRREGLAKYRDERLREFSGQSDHDVKTYGPGWNKLFNQIHAPQNDPNRITDDTQLYSHLGPGGDLTIAGVDFLRKELLGTHTLEGASEGAMKKDWLNGAHAIISQHNEFDPRGGRDPIGEAKFGQFSVLFQQAYENGRKAGKTPDQLLNEKSPDYLGKLMTPFVRSAADRLRDVQNANNLDLAGATAKPGTPQTTPRDLTTAAGITAAYKAGYYGVGPAAYDAALAELRAKGFAKPAAAPASAPTSSSLVPTN